MRVLRLVAAITVLSATLLAASPVAAHAKWGDATDNWCTMRITGFEHWGKGAASVEDRNSSCADMKPRVYYNDGDDWKTGGWSWNDYTKVDAGWGTDWSRARGWHESASPRSWSVWR